MRLEPAEACAQAVRLASRSPLPDPNPRVGCVLLAPDGTVLGEGWHRGAGTPHAEAVALADVRARGLDPRGATAYVTLEPCAHEGRTPSCAKALIAAEVAHVVYGQTDPNGSASGGAALIEAAGITTSREATLSDGSKALNAAWTFSVTHGRPHVTWKYASTLDGFSAASDGSSQWITGAVARADVHAERAMRGAIVVGTGTVLADDPRLTVRTTGGALAPTQPLRVVVGHREIPADARVRDGEAETLFLPTHDPHEVLAELSGRGIHAVWLEGGPHLAAAFLRADLVDEVLAYLAPSFLGAGLSATADFGAGTLTDRIDLVLDDVRTLTGPDTTDLRLRLVAHRDHEEN